jgi:hypothetical protein
MKLIDAELVMMDDNATEAARLDCAKFLRQQLRSYLTEGEGVAEALSLAHTVLPQTEAHIVRQEAEVRLENPIHYIGQLAETFPALASDWEECKRRANAMHQTLRKADNKAGDGGPSL